MTTKIFHQNHPNTVYMLVKKPTEGDGELSLESLAQQIRTTNSAEMDNPQAKTKVFFHDAKDVPRRINTANITEGCEHFVVVLEIDPKAAQHGQNRVITHYDNELFNETTKITGMIVPNE